MISKTERDNVLLGEILDELVIIDKRIAGGKKAYLTDENLQDAISMRLITLSELLNALSDEFHEENGDLPIVRVRGLRNLLAHAYGKIDFERLWKIIEEDYPLLSSRLRKIAADKNVS
ncbi:MAG TPA: HepT-like ribonuclease domain-containing protein [Candidatus Dormibacteraeota bacterium]|nr:HepT-like ribonuclease domain-containing protein [Candidatus Dormibacteraeota bacterium]